MIKKFFLGLYIILLSSILCVQAQQPTVTVKVDPSQIVIGDAIRYFISAQIDTSKEQLYWAQFPDTFNHLEIVERGKIDTIKNGSQWQFKQKLTLTGFDSGAYTIPSFLFIKKDRSSSLDSIKTDSFKITVQTVPVDTQQAFKNIKNIETIAAPSWFSNNYVWLIVVLLLIVIGFIIWFKRKKQVTSPVIEKTESLQERSLRLLNELDQEQLWQQERVKEYYSRLSEILRHYIEQRFQTPAMELTTQELLKSAKKHKELSAYRSTLKPILQAADLAKFAKARAIAQEHIDVMEQSKKFITNTQKREDLNPPQAVVTPIKK